MFSVSTHWSDKTLYKAYLFARNDSHFQRLPDRSIPTLDMILYVESRMRTQGSALVYIYIATVTPSQSHIIAEMYETDALFSGIFFLSAYSYIHFLFILRSSIPTFVRRAII